jgi:hypothetical protein
MNFLFLDHSAHLYLLHLTIATVFIEAVQILYHVILRFSVQMVI